MKINGKEINSKEFAYDRCHKIYLLDDEEDKTSAITSGYNILPVSELQETYKNSCELKFIYNWKLDKNYVGQFEKAVFE